MKKRFLVTAAIIQMAGTVCLAASIKDLPPIPIDPNEVGKQCVATEFKFETPQIKSRFFSDPENMALIHFWAKRGYKKRYEDGKCNDFHLAVSSWQKATGATVTGVISQDDFDSILRHRGLVPGADRKKEGALKGVGAN